MNKITKPNTQLQAPNFINGDFISANGEAFTIESPYFGEPVGVSHNSTSADVDKAVESAQRAFLPWSRTPLKERTQILFRLREELLKEADAISHTVSLENGKTLSEARAGLMKGIEVLEFALSLQNSDQGGRLEVSRGVFCEYRRKPLGVIANITPFNFPAMVPMWTLPIAIVTGNSYLWKPSEKCPLTSKLIAEAFQRAGLPAGVLTVVQGGRETVEAIIDHPLVKAVGFVGSTAVARAVFQRASQKGKRALALGGAKNHIVLLPDADPEIAGRGISDSFTGCAGQRCMAASTLLAVGNCEEQIAKIVERARSQKLGESQGAIIDRAQLEFLHKAIERAEQDGAKIILDGRKPQINGEFKNGHWLGPTILDHVDPKSEAATQELFGPILSIVRCSNISEALAVENANPYGNACSVFTKTGHLAEKVLKGAEAGMLGVNIGVPVPREPFSFAGINDSKFGHGEITGPNSVEFWTDLQKVTTKWELQNDSNWMS